MLAVFLGLQLILNSSNTASGDAVDILSCNSSDAGGSYMIYQPQMSCVRESGPLTLECRFVPEAASAQHLFWRVNPPTSSGPSDLILASAADVRRAGGTRGAASAAAKRAAKRNTGAAKAPAPAAPHHDAGNGDSAAE